MRITLIVLIVVTILLIISLPLFVNYYSKTLYRSRLIYSQIVLYLTYIPVAICAIIIEINLRKMFNTVCRNNSFVMENVHHLNAMGKTMIVVTIIFLIKTILLFSLAGLAFTLGSALLAIFCFVLSDIFHQAVSYKLDNDLTI